MYRAILSPPARKRTSYTITRQAGTRFRPLLSFTTLGRLELSIAGAPLLARRRKELVLLAFVARRAPRPVSRAELAALLWGEKDEARARQSLRQALSELRRVVGDALLVTADDVRLAADRLDFDVRRFEDAIAAGNPWAAVPLWRGEFLAGTEISNMRSSEAG